MHLGNIPGVITAVGHTDAVRPHKEPAVLKVIVNAKAAVVHKRVVLRAQQHQKFVAGGIDAGREIDDSAIEFVGVDRAPVIIVASALSFYIWKNCQSK